MDPRVCGEKGGRRGKRKLFFSLTYQGLKAAKSLFPFCIVGGDEEEKVKDMRRRRRRQEEKKRKKTFLWFFCVRTTSAFARFQRTLYFFPLSPNLEFLICRMREKKIIFVNFPFFRRGLTGKSPTDLLHPPPAANLRNSKYFFFSHFRRFFKGEIRARARVGPCRRDVRTLGGGDERHPRLKFPEFFLFCVPQLNYMQISSQKLSAKSTYISYSNVLGEKKNNLWFLKGFLFEPRHAGDELIIPLVSHGEKKSTNTHPP